VVVLEGIFACFLLLWIGVAVWAGRDTAEAEEPVRLERPYTFPEIFQPVKPGLTQADRQGIRASSRPLLRAANQERIYREELRRHGHPSRVLTPILYAER
jgi:hypothetical protein